MKNINLFSLVLIVGLWSNAGAQNYLTHTTKELQSLYNKATSDTVRVELLHEIGKSYMFRYGKKPKDQDSAIVVFNEAINLAKTRQWNSARLENTCRLGEAYLRKKEYATAQKYYLQVIDEHRQNGKKESEASTWLRYADKIMAAEIQTPVENGVENMLLTALQLYRDSGNKLRVADVYTSLTYLYLLTGVHDKALVALDSAFYFAAGKLDANRKARYNAFSLAIYQSKGYYNKALEVGLATTKLTFEDKSLYNWYLAEIGFLYLELGQAEKCVNWLTPAISRMKEGEIDGQLHWATSIATESLIRLGRTSEASLLISGIEKEYSPQNDEGRGYLARANAILSEANGRMDEAENFFRLHLHHALNMDNVTSVYGAEYDLGKFYLTQNRYSEAINHLQNSVGNKRGFTALTRGASAYLMLSQAEHALGNSEQAITYIQKHNQLRDSIFKITNARQIEELSIQYETEKKQAEIDKLGIDVKLKQALLDGEITKRNGAIIIIVLIVVMLGIVINSLLRNRRQNKLLTEQQAEIGEKNVLLTQHIDDKDKLLSAQRSLLNERERLLKEVHHRVKNNLQIVISLLDSQAASLKDFGALSAIQQSQHRLQTIAIIHHKLYQSEEMTLINMRTYVSEIVAFLRESFASNSLRFEVDIDEIELDVSQAVPIGLIINEAITNSIKYAFPEKDDGLIKVRMYSISNSTYEMEVTDNGIGMGTDFDPMRAQTLGMTLIKGFSQQLRARLEVFPSPGCRILLTFQNINSVSMAQVLEKAV